MGIEPDKHQTNKTDKKHFENNYKNSNSAVNLAVVAYSVVLFFWHAEIKSESDFTIY